MKMVEIKSRSVATEIEKLMARKEKAEAKLQKATDKADRLGCNWTLQEHYDWMKTVETEKGWIVNKEDVNKNGVWFDLVSAKREVKDLEERIENANARFEKVQDEVEKYHESLKKIEDAQQREELRRLEFEHEQKEWMKDGIKLDGRYYGYTPSGKFFQVFGNSGYTERSRHCVSLNIGGETVFTSGEFWRAYIYIKQN